MKNCTFFTIIFFLFSISIFAQESNLIITEIMYNPTTESTGEWIEIYNNGIDPIDLNGYVLDDNSGAGQANANILEGMLDPEKSIVLFDGDLTLEEFEAAWGNVDAIPVDNWPVLNNGAGGDSIGIWDSFEDYDGDNENQINVIEQVVYDAGSGWPSSTNGKSIFLIALEFDNTESGSWSLSSAEPNEMVTPLFETYTSTEGDIGSPGTPDVIVDEEAPEITCLDAVVIPTDESSCDASYPIEFPTATDNVSASDDIDIIGVRRDGLELSDPFPLGESIIDWTAEDEAGNFSDSCAQTITVEDKTPPVVVCQEEIIMVSTDGSDIFIEVPDPTITDNCDNDPTLFFTRNDGGQQNAFYPVGTTTIIWYAIDESINRSANCVTTVEVTHTSSMANDITSFSIPDQVGETEIDAVEKTVKLSLPFGTELNGLVPNIMISADATISPASGEPLDFTLPVIYNVIAGDGSEQEWTLLVELEEDDVPPMIDCPLTIEVDNDNGQCGAVVEFAPTATDNSGSVTVEADFMSGTEFMVGTTSVTVTATDLSGNAATCTFDVIVNDKEFPIISCVDTSVQLNAEGFADITPEEVDGGYSDNCDIDLISVSPLSFNEENIGENEVTINVIDVHGNSSSCTAIVTVLPFETNPTLSVTSFTLINADTDEPLYDLEEGMIININDLPTLNLNIDVQTTDDVESLNLELSGAKSHTMTENNLPYALYGNDGPIDYKGSTFMPGIYTFTAMPFSENQLGGEMGTFRTVNFEIVEGDPKPFVTTWKTDNPGTSEDNQVTIPTKSGETYNYSVNWGDGTSDSEVAGDITHTYETPGTYQVSIMGDFPRIYFNSKNEINGDEEKILSIDQWGSIQWSSMIDAFEGCRNLDLLATDIPDLALVNSLRDMFYECYSFIGNPSLNDWDVSSIKDMNSTFRGLPLFNQNIGNWDVGMVTDMRLMFASASIFNRDIGNWDVSKVIYFNAMFSNARAFNQDIGNWNVSSAEKMAVMFIGAESFNQDIGNWDVSNVSNIGAIFNAATSFNQPLNNWDVSKVTNMDLMFAGCPFNHDLSSWNVRNVISMERMFATNGFDLSETFNQNIGNWDVSKVVNLTDMFDGVTLSTENYDGILNGWSEQQLQSGVIFSGGLSEYCQGEAARQKLIEDFGWTITDAGKTADCAPAPLSITEITLIDADTDQPLFDLEDGMIISIDDLPTLNLNIDVQTTKDVESLQLELSGAKSHTMTENNLPYALYGNDGPIDYRGSIFELGTYTFTATLYSGNQLGGEMGTVKTLNFEIVEGDPKPFVTIWKTDNPGASEDNQITIPTFTGEIYDYTVDWGDGSSDTNVTGNMTHTYETAGTYQVSISGEFPRIYFNNLDFYTEFIGDELKLLNVEQWGDNAWSSMEKAFAGCRNMDVTAIDIPDFNRVANTSYMFFSNSVKGNSSFDQWEMESVEEMRFMFFGTGFNQNINSWDVSNVTTMDSMFADALFNQYIGDWDVSSVENFAGMFDSAHNFNQDIGKWNVSRAVDMSGMFISAYDFNQDIGNWDVSNVKYLPVMFNLAFAFDQDLGNWNVANVLNANAMFAGVTLSTENYDSLLNGWNTLVLQPNVSFDAGNSQYCVGEAARQNMIDTYDWVITDGNRDMYCPPAPFSVTKITLINADTNQPLFDLEGGMAININDLPTLNLTIDVQATEDVESLQLELSGSKSQLKTENRAPFALFGNDGPNDFIGSTFELGEYTFTATPYSEDFLGGEMGTPLSITFEIVEDLELNTLKISPNQATTLARASFERPTDINQILIFDMTGRLIDWYNPQYIKSGDDYVLDVNFYQQGTYIVKAIDNKGVPYQKQMVVKR